MTGVCLLKLKNSVQHHVKEREREDAREPRRDRGRERDLQGRRTRGQERRQMLPRLALVDAVRERVRLEPAAQQLGGHLCEGRRPPSLIVRACHYARVGVARHAEDGRHAARRNVGKQRREQRLHRALVQRGDERCPRAVG
jgi:hypothetical protein